MRALLSVYDKAGLVELAQGLAELGWELVASGNTSAALAEAGIAHREVADVTGSPEMLGGRVKTLHPKIHGGILADRSEPEHLADLEAHGIEPIDLVVCNLYPFSSDPSIELIDVGGPTMVRAAAKNFAHVGGGHLPADYPAVLASCASRRALATPPGAGWPGPPSPTPPPTTRPSWPGSTRAARSPRSPRPTRGGGAGEVLPPTLHLTLERAEVLRYGENPHQRGARYRTGRDAELVGRRGPARRQRPCPTSTCSTPTPPGDWSTSWPPTPARTAVAIIKHANPCGAAVAGDLVDRLRAGARVRPPFGLRRGGGRRRGGDAAVAEAIAAGPQADVDHRRVLRRRRHSSAGRPGARPPGCCRRPAPEPVARQLRSLGCQRPGPGRRRLRVPAADWQVVTARQPTDDEWRDLVLAWRVCGRTTSNAIAVVTDGQAVGVGAGQQSRVVAAEIAVPKAGERAKGGAGRQRRLLPLPRRLDVLAQAGVTAVVQPGGSVKRRRGHRGGRRGRAGHGHHRRTALPALMARDRCSTARRWPPASGPRWPTGWPAWRTRASTSGWAPSWWATTYPVPATSP